MERRVLAISGAIPAKGDRAVIEAKSAVVQVIVQLMRSLLQGIAELDRKIEEVAAVHPDFFIFDSLPGAGAVMAPRLLAGSGSQRDRYRCADELQTYSGIAPDGCISAGPVRSFCGTASMGERTPRRDSAEAGGAAASTLGE